MQIVTIFPSSDDRIRVVISDSRKWIEVGLETIYKKQLFSSINDLDIIEITNCSGSLANGTLVWKKIIRAKSYQHTPKVKIGDPIPLMQLPGVVSHRNTEPAPRVPGLVDSIFCALDPDEPSKF